MPSKLLGLGNPKKVIDHLRSIVDGAAITAIEIEMSVQVSKLWMLAIYHYRFADKQGGRDWRQRVSRLYYASYAASRAIRLQVTGHFSTEVTDHKKVGDLPNDFPDRARFNNKLEVLRDDRNTCDYDHASALSDLISAPADSTTVVKDFLTETKLYLEARGLALKGKP